LAREAEEAKLKAEREVAEERARKAELAKIEAERKEAAEKSAKERLAREAEVERLKAERDAAEERARKAEQARIEMDRKVREKSSVQKSHGEAKDQPIRERSREPKKGDTKTLTLPGGATMEMIYVVPGMFEWRPEVGKDVFKDAEYETRRRIRLTKGFWLGKYEVTQSQWESVMGDNPSEYKKWFFSSSTNYPVENVSWHDCQEFIKKVNSVVGCGVRLPTEAEWEYACRTGTKTAFNWGSDRPIEGAANCIYRDYKGDWHSVGHPVAVGSYEPNAWGFHDMHGNVNEWCQDRYEYWGTIREKIVEIVDPMGARVGVERVIRGGAWKYSYAGSHSSMRHYGLPDKKSEATGFRLACSVLP
jgi:formylglycine-generating enzyme required for sulfatase activity